MISFHTEEIDFQIQQEQKLISWITKTIQQEGKELKSINYIFCSDAYLLQINQQYLQHDTYTDIISFAYNEAPIEGDIFISIDRIKENALSYGVQFEQELHRVLIHGVLHFIGYLDKSPQDKKRMTQKENEYLAII